ncbi:MAG TPA: OB-fold nucleic acid binding domain-containing protein, partial [Marmoricola sp.]
QLEGAGAVVEAPQLPGMDPVGHTLVDLWATRISPDGHPFAHLRPMLTGAGIRSVGDLNSCEPDRRVHVAGLVTHRQRPGTAGGVTFLNLEDETGMLNVICTQGVWRRYRQVARNADAMVIRGVVERQDGVTNLVADRISSLASVNPDAERALKDRHQARNFH